MQRFYIFFTLFLCFSAFLRAQDYPTGLEFEEPTSVYVPFADER